MFDLAKLPAGARFFDWEDVPIVTDAEMSVAFAAFPDGLSPRNPSDVRNKAGETTREDFDELRSAWTKRWESTGFKPSPLAT